MSDEKQPPKPLSAEERIKLSESHLARLRECLGMPSIADLVARAEAAEAQAAALREALVAVDKWWDENWDCSASPGHDGYPAELVGRALVGAGHREAANERGPRGEAMEDPESVALASGETFDWFIKVLNEKSLNGTPLWMLIPKERRAAILGGAGRGGKRG